jgi:hypothetical protein
VRPLSNCLCILLGATRTVSWLPRLLLHIGTCPTTGGRGVGVGVGVVPGVGVGGGVGSPGTRSYAPISQATPCGRETPR